jgi:hypothetical protein
MVRKAKKTGKPDSSRRSPQAKPDEHIDPLTLPPGVDAITFIKDKLMESPANVGLLYWKYQAEFLDDPIGILERLSKLQPKADREKEPAPDKKPAGFELVTGDGKGIDT